VGQSWYVDETYVKVQGQWYSLYRAIDRDGNLVDARLSDTRDLAAAEAFFRSAWTVTGVTPDRITTDGHDAYPRAIRNVFGERVTHRTNRYLNNYVCVDLICPIDVFSGVMAAPIGCHSAKFGSGSTISACPLPLMPPGSTLDHEPFGPVEILAGALWPWSHDARAGEGASTTPDSCNPGPARSPA
jgi:DDE domain